MQKDFRKPRFGATQALFAEVQNPCREAGLALLGYLALDGSCYQANASKCRATCAGRIAEVGPQLEAESETLLRQVAGEVRADDERYKAT